MIRAKRPAWEGPEVGENDLRSQEFLNIDLY
jgi:hypothetical protein